MSISLRPLEKNDANYSNVIDLFKKSFPGAQRIPTWFLRFRLRNGKAGLSIIYSHVTWIGLIYITEHKDIIFIHFLAISEACRSVGYGAQVMDSVKCTHAEKRIALNIEELDRQASNYQQRLKRKTFYEKCGFSSSGFLVKEPREVHELLVLGGTISKEEIEEIYKSLFSRILGLLIKIKVTRI